MRILLADTVYPDFLGTVYLNPALTYDSQLKEVLSHNFGTSNFFSRHLQNSGWECQDVIVNSDELQSRWAFEHDAVNRDVLSSQIDAFRPDVIFLQDLSINLPETNAIIAAQCSCALPRDESLIRRCDVVFTSLPTHLPEFERLGVRGIFCPLAFDPAVIERLPAQTHRDIDVSFVGGLSGWQWNQGTRTLEAVAEAIPTAQFYGYGYDNAPKSVRDRFHGPAWGNEMYAIYGRSKLVINRHGEIASGFSNNLRMYEATGMGAVLVTERSKNLHDFFAATECVAYSGPEEAVWAIKGLLNNEPLRKQIAIGGQARTLRDHTYARRMKTVSDTLTEMLCGVGSAK